jgi:hypothetical protein
MYYDSQFCNKSPMPRKWYRVMWTSRCLLLYRYLGSLFVWYFGVKDFNLQYQGVKYLCDISVLNSSWNQQKLIYTGLSISQYLFLDWINTLKILGAHVNLNYIIWNDFYWYDYKEVLQDNQWNVMQFKCCFRFNHCCRVTSRMGRCENTTNFICKKEVILSTYISFWIFDLICKVLDTSLFWFYNIF